MESDFIARKRNSIQLSDHRRLCWSEWGCEQGEPVVFCTGAGMSSSLGFGAQSLQKRKLRLINVDRPGLGDSDAHPEKNLDSWVSDLKELLNSQNFSTCNVVGFSQGAPFALALGAAGIARRIAIVSGQDDFAYAKTKNALSQDVAWFVEQFQNKNMEFIESFAKSASADGLWDLIVSNSSEHDRKIYESEPFRTAYLGCLSEGFKNGPDAYVQDLVTSFSNWPFRLEDIQSRVDLWYGGHDLSSVHSPDFGATLSDRLPNNRYQFEADHGGSILWTHADSILESLISD